MPMEECIASTLSWQQLVVAAPNCVLIALALVMVYVLTSLWSTFTIGYNLQLLWEYLFLSIPDIVLQDLPTSVTCDDGVETLSEATKLLAQPPVSSSKQFSLDAVPGQIQCYDPSTKQFLGQVKAMNANDVHAICERAALAQKEWQQTTYTQRRIVLRTMQKYICANITTICRVSTRDSGKPAVDACLGEVLTTCEKIRTLCANGEIWLRPEARSTGPMFVHKSARVEYVPLGVIAPIAPWNYPYVSIFFA